MRRHGWVMGLEMLLFTMKNDARRSARKNAPGGRAHPCPATPVALLDHSFEPLVEPSSCKEQLLGNYPSKEP